MTVEVHLYTQSQPVRIENVLNTYQKGDLFCVMHHERSVKPDVDKFPLQHVFRIREFDNPSDSDVKK